MSLDSLAEGAPWPDRWGDNALFAFSGYDGATETAPQFVAITSPVAVVDGVSRFGFSFGSPTSGRLDIELPGELVPRIVLGDLIVGETGLGSFRCTFISAHTLAGELPDGGRVTLTRPDGPAGPGAEVVLECTDTSFAVAYGDSDAQARARAIAGLEADVAGRAAEILAAYPSRRPGSAADARLWGKCVSVMRVNTMDSPGSIGRWSTPDRLPHRHMWLWDSVFHSLGMNHVDTEVSWDILRAMLGTQRPDGMIPLCRFDDGRLSDVTQPPILAWGVWENYRRSGRQDRLAVALPILEKYLQWSLDHRRVGTDGLLSWQLDDDPLCRSGESGMDNSPRFDEVALLECVDYSVYVAHDAEHVARIARELGDEAAALRWERLRDQLGQAVHQQLWDPDTGFYFDRVPGGNRSNVMAVSGFLPLLLADIPPQHVDRLVSRLDDPETFGTRCPLPSVARSDPSWERDMWRGPTWINMNYLVVQGLRRHAQVEPASRLARQTIDLVGRYYDELGVLFEFYDSAGELPPTQCSRKGPPLPVPDLGTKVDVIRDFHWTAALTADLLAAEPA